MKNERRPALIVLAEDDDDDCVLLKTAFESAAVANEVQRVKDGVELLDFLLKRGDFAGRPDDGRALIVLLDLNMPRMDGREALREIKANLALRRIPVIVMTTSKADDDIVKSYDLGACSYLQKPVSFTEFVEAAKAFKRYWLETIELPRPREAAGG